MITDSLAKRYNQLIDELLKKELSTETISLIKKFDSRFKMQINQHFSLQQKYLSSTSFSKNQRLITHLFLKISSAWFCYEILILICKEFDLKSEILIVKESRRKGEEFRVDFLKESDLDNNSKAIITDYYNKTVQILDKVSNIKLRTNFLTEIDKFLSDLINNNKKIDKKDYNPTIESFKNEVIEIERTYRTNYKKLQKNRESFICNYLDFKHFIGFCYVLRNQYVHNGLAYIEVSNNDKLYVENLQNLYESLNQLILTLAVSIFKTINRKIQDKDKQTKA